jgi:hypothetical protein
MGLKAEHNRGINHFLGNSAHCRKGRFHAKGKVTTNLEQIHLLIEEIQQYLG